MERYTVEIGRLHLLGDVVTSPAADGIVVFAHGSGSSRLSIRNRHVAAQLNASGFATLLFDLLTETEAADRQNVFDVPFLGSRVLEAVQFVTGDRLLSHLPIGLFGASTGAAAALRTAAELPDAVRAVVSRGGRPDLAMDVLDRVKSATLLIVGGEDRQVIEMNRDAYSALQCEKRFEIIPGATHLFEEPGTMDRVVALAAHWFGRHLVKDKEAS